MGPGGCERPRGFQEEACKKLQDPDLQESPDSGQKRETEAAEVGETDLGARRHEGEEAMARSVHSRFQRVSSGSGDGEVLLEK